jgi:hypothetical protein
VQKDKKKSSKSDNTKKTKEDEMTLNPLSSKDDDMINLDTNIDTK